MSRLFKMIGRSTNTTFGAERKIRTIGDTCGSAFFSRSERFEEASHGGVQHFSLRATMQPDKNNKASRWFVTAAVASCLFQLFWFASKCFNQIDFDGMSYVGIARHLRHGEFHASINAFRSPFISWLIALASFASPDYLHIGKLINVAAF